MGRKKQNGAQSQTQRQLRVAEQLRHALSQLFSEAKHYHPDLGPQSITVTEVRIGPDLKSARAYVIPFSVDKDIDPKSFISTLNELAPQYRMLLNKQLRLKYSPQITFLWDKTFDYAHQIDVLLKGASQDDAPPLSDTTE